MVNANANVRYSISDLYLIPVAMFRDPFLGGTAKLVMCEVYNPDKKPNATNFRASCAANMLKASHFRISQSTVEGSLYSANTKFKKSKREKAAFDR